MEGERTSRAKARIDAALARIEAAALNNGARGDLNELEGLRQRHHRLRSAVQEGLEQLDALIEGSHG